MDPNVIREQMRARAQRAREIGWPALLAEEGEPIRGNPGAGRAPVLDSARPVIEDWPFAVTAISKLRSDSDRGVGDTVARLIGPVGGDAFKVWYQRVFGHSCGCQARQEWLNVRYSYPS